MEGGYSNTGRNGIDYGQPIGGVHNNGSQSRMGPQGMVINQSQPQVVNVVSNQNFGTHPVSMICQFCKNPITTVVDKNCSCISFCLCWITCFFFWICIQSCRKKELNCWNAAHICPSCNQQLGFYNSC